MNIFKSRTRLFGVTAAVLIVVSTVFFYFMEDWTLVQSFYFTVSTLTTVGYGDFVPSSEASRFATAIFMLFGIGAFITMISILETSLSDKRHEISEQIEKKNSKK